MIVNTRKIYRSVWQSSCLAGLVSISMLACQSTWWSPGRTSLEQENQINSVDWSEQTTRSPLLSLSAEDYQGLSSRGAPVQWHPMLMPLRTGLSLTDRNFVLGTPNPLGGVDGLVPETGHCQLLSTSSTLQNQILGNEGAEKTVVRIELQDQNGKRSGGQGGQMFFIHEPTSRFVRAIGFWDDDGLASCSLPVGRWLVSTGFGEARTHKSFTTTVQSESRVSIRQFPRSRITIRAGKDTGIQYGDLMRIGRLHAMQPAPQSAEQLPEVSILVQDDLLRPVLNPSENQGVREYLFTSLLIQRPEFSLQLDPGEYVIGLWRNGSIHRCSTRLEIHPNENAILACDPNMLAERLPQQKNSTSLDADGIEENLKTLIFDGSFMPSRFLGQSSFRAWMAKSGVTRFLRAGRSVDTQQQQIQFLLQPILQAFSSDNFQRPEGPFIGDFRLTQRTETDEKMGRANFARLLVGQSGLNVESILNRVFSSSFSQSIPLAGTSERGLLEGVVPLTFRTTLKSNFTATFRTEGAEALASNGADIQWIEPNPAIVGAPLKLGPQGRVRIRLVVPPEDTTENLGMFINGERFKQWNVGTEQNKRNYRVLEIDEKLSQANDFLIGFAAWGQSYLPEFMYGVRQLPALSFTRLYCVDVNENGICDKQ